jgi:isoleucyl-tRNA synthetase
MKAVQEAARRGDWERLADGRARVGSSVLEPGEWELRLEPRPGVACEPLAGSDAIVVLDLELTDALRAEGVARDVVRGVQQARKEAGLHVSDRIRLALALPEAWRGAVESHLAWIAEQTLARRIELVDALGGDGLSRHEARFGEHSIGIGLARWTD